MRSSLAGLLGLIAVTAVGLAALTHPTQLWADAAFSLALSLNFGAVVAWIATDRKLRKMVAGFAVCGWGYLVLSLAPGSDTTVGNYLITTHLIAWCYQRGVVDPFTFTRIAHSLISIASGLAGTTLAWYLEPRTDLDRPSAARAHHDLPR